MPKKGFTLTEIIVGMLASLALVRYQKVIERTRERTACMHLIAIHSANEVYEGRANGYLPGTDLDVTAINSGLGLNIIADDFIFDYDCVSPFTTYQAMADFQSGGDSVFMVRVNQTELTEVFSGLDPAFSYKDFIDTLFMQTKAEASVCTPTNPCCASGVCPTLADCC